MKQCLDCKAPFDATRRICPACGNSPALVDGFDAYAPELAHQGSGFNSAYFSELAGLEEANFWFRARNKLIVWALKTYAPGFDSFLEVGCGTGCVLTAIADHCPGPRLSGSEIFTEGLGFASKRLPSVELMQMDARRIPFVEEYDSIGAFDVLEHIKEDEMALNQIHKSLKPNGIMLITVPQHPWLWSAMDDYAFHVRRYSFSEIQGKIQAAGFRVIRSTSFVTSLLPAMIVSRLLQRGEKINIDPTAELRINPLLNSFFEKMLNAELAGIRLGMDYPIGGSRLVVAQKA